MALLRLFVTGATSSTHERLTAQVGESPACPASQQISTVYPPPAQQAYHSSDSTELPHLLVLLLLQLRFVGPLSERDKAKFKPSTRSLFRRSCRSWRTSCSSTGSSAREIARLMGVPLHQAMAAASVGQELFSWAA